MRTLHIYGHWVYQCLMWDNGHRCKPALDCSISNDEYLLRHAGTRIRYSDHQLLRLIFCSDRQKLCRVCGACGLGHTLWPINRNEIRARGRGYTWTVYVKRVVYALAGKPYADRWDFGCASGCTLLLTSSWNTEWHSRWREEIFTHSHAHSYIRLGRLLNKRGFYWTEHTRQRRIRPFLRRFLFHSELMCSWFACWCVGLSLLGTTNTHTHHYPSPRKKKTFLFLVWKIKWNSRYVRKSLLTFCHAIDFGYTQEESCNEQKEFVFVLRKAQWYFYFCSTKWVKVP